MDVKTIVFLSRIEYNKIIKERDFMYRDKVKVKNYMEEAVLEHLDGVIKDIDCCKCENCLSDIVALTLNILKPQYFSSQKGQLYDKAKLFHLQYEVDIITTIIKAVGVVKNLPHHE